jgi:hypothetical protein
MTDESNFPFSDLIGLKVIEYDDKNKNMTFACATNAAVNL